MDRVIGEQGSFPHRQPEETYGLLNTSSGNGLWSTLDGDVRHVDPSPVPPEPHQHLLNRTLSAKAGDTSSNDGARSADCGPSSFFTATSLYRSHLPTHRQAKSSDAEAGGQGKPRSPAPHRPPAPVMGEDDTPPQSRRHHFVPSPATYEVLPTASQVPVDKHYPTPPWWRRYADGTGEEEEGAVQGNVEGPMPGGAIRASFLSSPSPQSKKNPTQPGVTRFRTGNSKNRTADDAAQSGVARPPATLSGAPPPPPSRSRTCSVAAHSHSLTASPSPTNRTMAETDSSFSSVDPELYRRPLTHVHRRSSFENNTYRRGIAARHDVPSPESTPSHHSGVPFEKSRASFRSSRGASVDSSTSPFATSTVETTTTAAATKSSAPRLRIYEESAAHPSGFAVPRRGAGTAAPRTLYNGLAILPATVADHHAIACSASGGRASAVYGTGNHPSTYNIQRYRENIAAVTGVDPSRLRKGVLNQHYTRVHSGWTEVTAASSGAAVGTQWMHTTTRLRIGFTGGGAPRAPALQDPVSGQSRKPNEVSPHYLMKVMREDQRARLAAGPHVFHLRDNDDDGNAQAASVSSTSLSRECPHRGEGHCSLATEKRVRAHRRSSLLHATHDFTGVSLPPDEQRLYWAEHVPLHHTSVRGLNALLQGVGEAEVDNEDDVDISHQDSGDAREWVDAVGSSLHADPHREPHQFGSQAEIDSTSMRRTTPPKAAVPHNASATTTRRPEGWCEQEVLHLSTLPRRPGRRPVDDGGARQQLQDALRQRHGLESTLTASSILPAAYRHSPSPVRDRRYAETADAANTNTSAYEISDVYDQVTTAHDGGGGGGGTSAETGTECSLHGGAIGLVDSHMSHGAAGASVDVGRTASAASSASAARNSDRQPAFDRAAPPLPQQHQRHGGYSDRRRTQKDSLGPQSLLTAGGTAPASQRAIPFDPSSRPALLLFPPMMTPLLQEVDECLRFHGLPTMRDVWQWSVADQSALLTSAGFSASECRTIVWELERMIRTTSTTCAVAV